MQQTEYLNLNKPEIGVDKADVNVLNANMDILDTAVHDLQDSVGVEANPAGTASEDLTKLKVGQIIYGITGGGGGSANLTELTEAEYEALKESGQLVEDMMYFITDKRGGDGQAIAFSEDIAGGVWSLLITQQGAAGFSTETAVPAGTTHIAIAVDYQNQIWMPAVFNLAEQIRLAKSAGRTRVNYGLEWVVWSDHDTIAYTYDISTNKVAIAAGYSGVTIRAYAIQAAKASVPEFHTYDDTEKLVGTWFSQPLYEKTIILKANNVDKYTYSSEIYQNCLPPFEYIDVRQIYMARGDASIGYVDIAPNYNEVFYVPNKNGDLYLKNTHSPTDIIITIQYTKPIS